MGQGVLEKLPDLSITLCFEVISKGWIQKVNLLWLDGDHTYEGVKRNFQLWGPHLATKAVIVFHDYTDDNLGAKILIDELLKTGNYFVTKQI